MAEGVEVHPLRGLSTRGRRRPRSSRSYRLLPRRSEGGGQLVRAPIVPAFAVGGAVRDLCTRLGIERSEGGYSKKVLSFEGGHVIRSLSGTAVSCLIGTAVLCLSMSQLRKGADLHRSSGWETPVRTAPFARG